MVKNISGVKSGQNDINFDFVVYNFGKFRERGTLTYALLSIAGKVPSPWKDGSLYKCVGGLF